MALRQFGIGESRKIVVAIWYEGFEVEREISGIDDDGISWDGMGDFDEFQREVCRDYGVRKEDIIVWDFSDVKKDFFNADEQINKLRKERGY